MRGNPSADSWAMVCLGSIPAHAGKPVSHLNTPISSRVYPRACGETSLAGGGHLAAEGLSPRMRGNQKKLPYSVSKRGSIPAHAGKPGTSGQTPGNWGVYPRACGETRMYYTHTEAYEGLSPRMRGNLFDPVLTPDPKGSIPAHAGKPVAFIPTKSGARVYPRACGETCLRHLDVPLSWGLSPRMRGNPRSFKTGKKANRVYPRACGETEQITV